MDEREVAWERVHEALPARWQVGRPIHNPADGTWSVTAMPREGGRQPVPVTVTGTGGNEATALFDLDARLRGEYLDQPRRSEELEARLRLAYLQGAEERSQSALGRPLRVDELERVIDRIPDSPEEQ